MDKARFVAIFMAFLSYSQNAFLKWRHVLLDPSLWRGWEQVIMNLVCSLGGKGLWKERSYLFGEEFRSLCRKRFDETTPHPEAKPFGAFSVRGESQ